MKIIFIGSGNLATRLAKTLNESGGDIAQIYSRTLENAKTLAELVGATYTDDIEQVNREADLYIFSVKDDALPDILSRMSKTTGVWVHTAGSVSMDIFSKYTDSYGVIYPLQTFGKGRAVNFADIPVFIEGSSSSVTNFLEMTAKRISKNVNYMASEKRLYLHLAAVFACNFANHLYTISSEILEKENIPFDVLRPLIAETTAKVMDIPPKEAQTGPAVRFDETVINKHLDLLTDSDLKEIYSLLSGSIYKRALPTQ
jgi:predicted short-subunit dehydrogenase-like oxidoreductase (DUF2520 family)